MRRRGPMPAVLAGMAALSWGRATAQPAPGRVLAIADAPSFPYDGTEAIARRLALYRALGVTVIAMECGWSDSETAPGVWRDPTWLPYMRAAIAAGFGIDLVLETVSAPPAWFVAAHPDSRLVDRSGQVGTHALSYWWPGLDALMREKTEALLARLARAGVLGSVRSLAVSLGTATEALYPSRWTLGPGAAAPSMWYYDVHAQADFPRRMRERYGTLDALNAAWGTSLARWSQVRPPDPGTVHGQAWADVLTWYRDSKRRFVTAQVEGTLALLRRYAPAGHVPPLRIAVGGDHVPPAAWAAEVASGGGEDPAIVAMPDSAFLLDLAARVGAVAHFTGMPDTEELQYLQGYIAAHGYRLPLTGENAGTAAAAGMPEELAGQAFRDGLAGYELVDSAFLLEADGVTPGPLYPLTRAADARLLAAWRSGSMSPMTLPAGFSLIAGGCVTVDEAGPVRLCLSARGRLAVSRGGATLWVAEAPERDCDLARSWLQGCHLTVQGDGNVVLYDGAPAAGTAYWNTATSGTGRRVLLSATAPFLTVLDARGATLWSSGPR